MHTLSRLTAWLQSTMQHIICH